MIYLPNLLTFARIGMVLYLIILLKNQQFMLSLLVFIAAGISDALDGFIARRFNARTYLGAMLDPVADKILLVSIYVMFSILQLIPFWLMLAVVLRDIVIVGGYSLMAILFGPVQMRPLKISKLNTFLQICFIIIVLTGLAWQLDLSGILPMFSYVVLLSSLSSGLAYVYIWSVKALNDSQIAKVDISRIDIPKVDISKVQIPKAHVASNKVKSSGLNA